MVTNVGPVSTGSTQWTDKVYLTLNGIIDQNAILVSTTPNGSALDPQGQYSTQTANFTIPIRYSGNVSIVVETNSNSTVDTYPNTTNNTAVQQIYVTPTPLADLVVSNVTAPSLTFPGQQATVDYTVTNKGPGPTNVGNYAEQIWLSVDKQRPNPGVGDILLTEIQYTGGVLQPGQGYDRSVTVTLPQGLVSGTYYLTAWVDPYGTVLQAELVQNVNPDDPNEIQNDNYKAGNSTTGGTQIIGTPVIPAPQPDVTVTSVTATPVAVATGQFTYQLDGHQQRPRRGRRSGRVRSLDGHGLPVQHADAECTRRARLDAGQLLALEQFGDRAELHQHADDHAQPGCRRALRHRRRPSRRRTPTRTTIPAARPPTSPAACRTWRSPT